MSASESDAAVVTQLLQKWSRGDAQARDELVPIVYRTLHRLAEHYLANERHAPTLQPTALVHEAYLRLVSQDLPDWSSRKHFYGVAAHLMRQVLVDHARRRLSGKRGAGAVRLELEDAAHVAAADGSPLDILVVNDALDDLARVDERKSKVIELRYFGGCTVEETAKVLSVSIATVKRDLRLGEAWLVAHLGSGSGT
jgi:RNA polymerase sigma factor (TIGR02999 family)